MQKTKSFFYVYIKSLTSLKYYKELINVSHRFSFKYFLALALIASIVNSISISTSIIPQIQELAYEIEKQALNIFPDDLVLTLENGELSINQETPYFIDFPTESDLTKPPIDYLVVIDENGKLDDLYEYETFALINSKNIIIKEYNQLNSSGRTDIEVIALNDFPDGEFNKQTVEYIITEVKPIVATFIKFIPLIVFSAVIFYYFIFRLFYLLIVATVLFCVGLIDKLNLRFGKYYQFAIHSMTLPLTLELVMNITGIHFKLPFWFFLLNITVGILAIIAIRNDIKNGGTVTNSAIVERNSVETLNKEKQQETKNFKDITDSNENNKSDSEKINEENNKETNESNNNI